MSKPILVSGLGRCGTSLVMKMLDVAGIPVFAEYGVSYEHPALSVGAKMERFLPLIGTSAAKILDPQLLIWPERVNASVIWLDRNPREQAKSQLKFLRLLGVTIPGGARRGIEGSIKRDVPICLRLYGRLGVRLMRFHFEDILHDPLRTAARMALFIEREADHHAMARVVIKRNPQCATGLEIEQAAISAEIQS